MTGGWQMDGTESQQRLGEVTSLRTSCFSSGVLVQRM